ncbi:MAG: hypothetical protein ABR518_06645 [Actinomycetota bacterium]
MAEGEAVQRAIEHARAWVDQLGPAWVARFDQLSADVRQWAAEVGVDPRTYEFKAAWCVATTFLHGMAKSADQASDGDGEEIHRLADILATVGLWEVPAGA